MVIMAATIGAAVYFFRIDLFNLKNNFYQQFLPCQEPITYSLGQFDSHFGISQANFLAAVSTAEKIWEKPIGTDLFKYAPSGTLKINLIYDYRQAATLKLRQLGIIVKDDQATYDQLKTKYEALQKNYVEDKAILDGEAATIKRRADAYNADVEKWNRQGGAPPAEVEMLNSEKAILNELLDNHNAKQKLFNNNVNEINALADTLNRLAQTLNLSVARYNTVGASRGREFEEGTYVSSAAVQEIDIYEFDNTNKLVRVLAHEFGHALGLEHVSSTNAIMYYLNNGVNEKLTSPDLLELKKHCGIK